MDIFFARESIYSIITVVRLKPLLDWLTLRCSRTVANIYIYICLAKVIFDFKVG